MKILPLALIACVLVFRAAARGDDRLELPDGVDHAIHIANDALIPIDIASARPRQAIPILLRPAAAGPLTLHIAGQTRTLATDHFPRIRIDPRRYADRSTWRPDAPTVASRRRAFLLATALAATLVLASLLPRRAAWGVVAVAAAWSVLFAMQLARRPTRFEEDLPAGRWIAVTRPQAIVLPIGQAEPWVPVVESVRHMEALDPHIAVTPAGPVLHVFLPANGRLFVSKQDRRAD